ncbi:extracellular solute-binding protein [Acidovorax sp.]|uniref:ABC transporter substrate-binding protein n=1 Tax=Acidovorax sp. TaxID=1872122 RepID=UPI00261E0833|nr:extracellular solute-binding protein [Acidovorax sp.]
MPARFHALAVAAAVTAAGLAHAGTVTVVTSFPKELTETYRKAFEAKHPGIQLEILNKNTKAGIAHLRETPVGQRPDVFWVSDPSAFEVLGREKLLQKAPEVRNPLVPAKIGNYPVNDPDGLYFGQALSGYGIMTNTRYLQTNKLPAPKQWADLTRPVYYGHVAISAPSRSGTTHLTVETILQGEGWDKGWRQLLQIGGNLAAVTDRSLGVPEGVNSGQYGIGIVVDFFGLSGRYSGFPVDFVYPTVTAVVPANIGLIAGAKNADEGKKFIAYTLSQEGQELLFDPKVSRMPVLPYSVAGLKVPADFPNIYKIARKAKVQFNAGLSEERYPLVTALFDQMITLRLKDLQAATLAINDAEAKLAARPSARGTELIHQARNLAYMPLVGEDAMKGGQFLELFRKNKQAAAASKQLTGTEEMWGTKAKTNYVRAEELAKQAAALAR